MNVEKVAFGFVVVPALSLNLGFVAGEVDYPARHAVVFFLVVVVNIIVAGLKRAGLPRAGRRGWVACMARPTIC